MALGCNKVLADLGRLVDGELGPSRRAAVEEHLLACAACRAEKEALVRVGEGLRARVADEVAEVDLGSLWAGIERGIRQQPAPLPLGERLSLWLGETLGAYRKAWIAAGAVAALVLAVLAPALMRTPKVHNAVAIESIETADTDDGTTSTAIFKVPDGKGGTTTVIWVTEPDVPDGSSHP